MLDSDDTLIGGQGIVVQVDETKMGKRKHHRGHRVDGAWVIVGVELTENRRVFAEVVEDRSSDTIIRVLSGHIAQGSILHTDCWRGYTCLSQVFGIEHMTVNHSIGFKDEQTGVHTNHVEGTNYALKRSIPPRCRTSSLLQPMLSEFIWRRKNVATLWSSFIDVLKDVEY
jgi:transposase-like protein